ncbi:DUF1236 domain-containing protein [Mangrovibrevibacter kandeliae]|uniref:DUF1236 domain-containing protein n=1 Tax=Mangrovibrevibacter kandeliae TaxID=2968473 RepID=UPI00211748CB|nr:DUF1236 domain-containing protein [Aurantimonas sp. CSK15Z-1]MCQ8780688.1 DUF1236 domain-containing protein [Aurantimonas sp. CSK15Z-1]
MTIRTTLLAGAAALCAFAAAPALAQTAVSATTDLNVRAGPDPQFEVVTVIPGGDAAMLNGCNDTGSWCQVDYNGVTGWAYSDYLSEDVGGQTVIVTQRRDVPVVTYEQTYERRPTVGRFVAGPQVERIAPPPQQRIQYIESNPVDPVYLEGEAVVGAQLPEAVPLRPIPDYDYDYVYVNGQPMLVDPRTRQVVYVVR